MEHLRVRLQLRGKDRPAVSPEHPVSADYGLAVLTRSGRRSNGSGRLHAPGAILLLHDWAHLDMWLGSAWQRLREQQDASKISILGASVYHPHEALAALAEPAIQHLQFPMNVLDWRWKQIESAVTRRPAPITSSISAHWPAAPESACRKRTGRPGPLPFS